MKKVLLLIFIIVFIALTVLPVTVMAISDNSISDEKISVENRELAQMPELFSKSNKPNLKFTKEFDDYFSDHFGLRIKMVSAWSLIKFRLFNESSSDEVVAGRDDWLFSSKTMDDWFVTNQLTERGIFRLINSLEMIQDYVEEQDCKFIFTVVPNKNTLYGEYMPPFYVKGDESGKNLNRVIERVDEMESDLQDGYLNIHNYFSFESGDTEPLYLKFDTHWNNCGAMMFYRQLMEKAAEAFPDLEYDDYSDITPELIETDGGDLKNMILPGYPLTEKEYDYGIPEAAGLSNPMDRRIELESDKNDFTAMFVRDSFFNSVLSLTGNNFGESIYLRSMSFDSAEFFSMAPDIYVIETVERDIASIIDTMHYLPAPGFVNDNKSEDTIDTNKDDSIDVFGEYIDDYDYPVIRGFIDKNSISESDAEIYVKLTGKKRGYWLDAFPILCEDLYDAAKEKNGADYKDYGFSLCLPTLDDYDEDNIYTVAVKEGTYELSLIIAQGDSFRESDVFATIDWDGYMFEE